MNNNPIEKPNKFRWFSYERLYELRQEIIQCILEDQEKDLNEVNDPDHPSREELIMKRGCIAGFCAGLTYVLTTSNHRMLICLIVGIAVHALTGAIFSKIYPPTTQN